jgi:mono/diheme cytochrome c family protein
MKRIAIALLMIGAASCYYDNEELLYGEQECTDTSATYSGRVSQILSMNCLQCHSQSAAFGGVVLDGYPNVKTLADNGRLMGAITHSNGFSPMPKNAPMLRACDIEAIRLWIENGSQNN